MTDALNARPVNSGVRWLLSFKVMNVKFYNSLIVLILLVTYLNASALEKRKTITGTVVAYHPSPCRLHQCSVWVIVRTKDSKEGSPHYVQMRIEYYYSPSFPNNGFPKELVDSAREWRFQAERDAASDIAIPKYVKLINIKTGEDTTEKGAIPAWILLPGAEGEKLPYGEVLPAYNVEYSGYKLNGKDKR